MAVSLFDGNGSLPGAIESTRDITNSRNTGLSLRESEEKLPIITAVKERAEETLKKRESDLKTTSQCPNLTPAEIQIASLIKTGKTRQEISKLPGISPGAINFHRNNIRKKLGLNRKKVNLASHLSSLP